LSKFEYEITRILTSWHDLQQIIYIVVLVYWKGVDYLADKLHFLNESRRTYNCNFVYIQNLLNVQIIIDTFSVRRIYFLEMTHFEENRVITAFLISDIRLGISFDWYGWFSN